MRFPSFRIGVLAALALVGLGAAVLDGRVKATRAAVSSSPTYRSLVHLYHYDASTPLDAREGDSRTEGALRIINISYESPKLGRVSGYLVLPKGDGPFPTIVWMAGLDGLKDDFLSEAMNLANSGAAGLLLDADVARPPYPRLFTYDPKERDTWIRNIVDLRRGIDFLATRPEIDMHKLAYAGLSFGADTGTILVSVDHRFKAAVIASGGATQLDMLKPGGFFYRKIPAKKRATYIKAAITPFEPYRYAAHLAPAAVFFQHGKNDPSFSRANQERLDRTASSPRRAVYYHAGHELNSKAIRDRKTWLLLGLK